MDSGFEKALFRFRPPNPGGHGAAVEVSLEELKAVFFVKDFGGNPTYGKKKHFTDRQQPADRKIEVTFMDDDELLIAPAPVTPQAVPSYFLTPADPRSNKDKILVVASAIVKFRCM